MTNTVTVNVEVQIDDVIDEAGVPVASERIRFSGQYTQAELVCIRFLLYMLQES